MPEGADGKNRGVETGRVLVGWMTLRKGGLSSLVFLSYFESQSGIIDRIWKETKLSVCRYTSFMIMAFIT